VVGDGEMLNTYKSMSSSNVTFTGRVAPESVRYWINQCDVLYLSTLKSKVFNYGQSLNKFREYLASGRPIIFSYEGYIDSFMNSSGIKYTQIDNTRDIKEAIFSFYNYSHEQLELASNSNKKIAQSQFSYGNINKNYLKTINKLLG
jgi:glycosyltransferase involved in cell wall biosynthesis